MSQIETTNGLVGIDISALSCGARIEDVELVGYLKIEESLDWSTIIRKR